MKVVFVCKGEYKSIFIIVPFACRVKFNAGVSSESSTVFTFNNIENGTLIVALGMISRTSKAILSGSIDFLELDLLAWKP